MSIPACIWASQKGRELKLTCPERVMLWQLAERANGENFCWPSIIQIMEDTGLARQTVILVIRSLATLGLIRIEKKGQRHIYHVLKPVQNKTGDRSKSRPVTGLDSSPDRSRIATRTGLDQDPNLLREPVQEPKRRADAREPDQKISSLGREGKQGAAPLPDTFNEHLANPTPGSALPGNAWRDPNAPRSEAVAEAEKPPDPTEAPVEDAVMAAKLAALTQQLGQSMRHFAIPPGPSFSADEQRDLCTDQPRPKAYYAPDAVLRAARMALAERAAA